MDIQIKTGNPVVLTEAEAETCRRAVNCADTSGAIDTIELNANNLVMVSRNGVRKTLKYPPDADVRWVIQKINAFSQVAGMSYRDADKTSNRFVALCAEILNTGGNVTFQEQQSGRYPYRTYDAVILSLVKENGHTFTAQCETSTLSPSAVERIKRLAEEETLRRKEVAEEVQREKERREETERLRELAYKHGLI